MTETLNLRRIVVLRNWRRQEWRYCEDGRLPFMAGHVPVPRQHGGVEFSRH